MQVVAASHLITAIVYRDGATFGAFLKDATDAMTGRGLRLAGLIQESRTVDERRQCDLYLRDLTTGDVYGMSNDRGHMPGAAG